MDQEIDKFNRNVCENILHLHKDQEKIFVLPKIVLISQQVYVSIIFSLMTSASEAFRN